MNAYIGRIFEIGSHEIGTMLAEKLRHPFYNHNLFSQNLPTVSDKTFK